MVERADGGTAGRAGSESSDVRPTWVLLTGLGLAAGAGLIALLLLGFSQFLGEAVEQPPPGPLATMERVPPAPRLQADPALELKELQAEARLILESYGWVDPDAGIARIPIERAMTLLVERGWPNPVEGSPAVAAPPAAPVESGGGQ
ncbi:MAG: hypothetical protein R3349_01350 [Geminicoccaceae bacterium]|nr:hypothetical protein [Geminicoccaceae bacterium]